MSKVQIAITPPLVERLYTWLQDREIIHVSQLAKERNDTLIDDSLDVQLAHVQFALEFIARVRDELDFQPKRTMRDLFAGKPIATLERLEQSLVGLKLDDLLVDMRSTSDTLAGAAARQEEIAGLLEQMKPWESLDVTGEGLQGTQHVRYALLAASVQEEILIKRKLLALETVALREVGRTTDNKRGRVFWEALVLKDCWSSFVGVLSSTSAEEVVLPVPHDQTVSEYVRSLRAEAKRLTQQTRSVLEGAKRYVALEQDLRFAYDALLHRQERARTRLQSAQLPFAEILAGWVPKHELTAFEHDLQKAFPTAALEEVTPSAQETPPTHLKNSPLIRPFEAVTNIFGQPKYTELDPTGPLSIFFLIAFGLALTDAGYGIVMMLLMWAAEKFFRLNRSMRNMVRLLFYAGASTTLFGALTGGWFGIDLAVVPGEIGGLLRSMQLINPIDSPLLLLVVALAIGILQLLFAWMVSGYDHWRKKDYVALIFDDLAWIAMVVAVLLWAGAQRGLWFSEKEQLLWYAVLTVGALLVLSQGRSYKNPALKLGGGLLSLYGLVNFLSDTLSYSRLLALGLATGIIALVVNLIGSMVVEAVPIPIVGWFLATIVLLGGHVFNLGINALGAFIHSGRLQFVEFFPKFVTGGGKPYRPFGRVGKYVANPREFI